MSSHLLPASLPPTRSNDRPAVVAGRYLLADRVGEGGSGTVWRAWDRRSEEYVATKLLHEPAGEPLQRLVREQSVRIRHWHVLAARGWAAEDDLVVLVTDLVRGGSLLDLLRRAGPLPEGLAALLLDQLLQALVAVHGTGVVHGDVKPANVLLDPTGTDRPRARLADFGLAALPGDPPPPTAAPASHPPAEPAGTPGYLAPERLEGARPHPAGDVYAAGVTGRRLLAGTAAVTTLLDSMTRPEARLRPTATGALERLRSLPVDRGAPWPDVPDRLGPDPPRPPQHPPPGTRRRWFVG